MLSSVHTILLVTLKLDGVGPVDNWPSYNRWHMTHDTWHMTRDRWCAVNILSKFQLSSSNSFGVTMFWRSGGKVQLFPFCFADIHKLDRYTFPKCLSGSAFEYKTTAQSSQTAAIVGKIQRMKLKRSLLSQGLNFKVVIIFFYTLKNFWNNLQSDLFITNLKKMLITKWKVMLAFNKFLMNSFFAPPNDYLYRGIMKLGFFKYINQYLWDLQAWFTK